MNIVSIRGYAGGVSRLPAESRCCLASYLHFIFTLRLHRNVTKLRFGVLRFKKEAWLKPFGSCRVSKFFDIFSLLFFRVSAFWMELGHQGGTGGGWGGVGGGQLWLGLRNASVLTNKPALFLALFAFVA